MDDVSLREFPVTSEGNCRPSAEMLLWANVEDATFPMSLFMGFIPRINMYRDREKELEVER